MILLFKIILTLTMAFSQEENEKSGSLTFALMTGPLLPSNMLGVTEIQSTAGVRFGIPNGDGGYYELGYTQSNSNGVTIQNPFLSFKSEKSIETILVQLYAGIDYTMYETALGNEFEEVGGHIGSSMLVQISRTGFFRTDMAFKMQPGSSLYIGFGYEKRFSEKKEDK